MMRTRPGMPVGRGKSRVFFGLVSLAVGLVATIGSYLFVSSRGGGIYFVCWGAIVVGIVSIVRGLAQESRDRKAERARPAQLPDWYPDPQNQGMMRWWDGRAWTADTRPHE